MMKKLTILMLFGFCSVNAQWLLNPYRYVIAAAGPAGIVVDNTQETPHTGVADSLVQSFTTGSGSDRLMLIHTAVWPVTDAALVTEITYAGEVATSLGVLANVTSIRGTLYYLVAPATGTNDVHVVFDGGTGIEMALGVITYTGVDQGTPTRNYTENTDQNTPYTNDMTGLTTGDTIAGFMAFFTRTVTEQTGWTDHWSTTQAADGSSTACQDTTNIPTTFAFPGWTGSGNDKFVLQAIALQPAP